MRPKVAREDGVSFPEIMVVVMLMTLAGAFFYTFLFSVQRSVSTQTQRSQNNEDARLALERLDREIRSGNVLYNPNAETDPGYTLRVYTQSHGVPRCVQWRIHDQQLQRRTWQPNSPGTEAEHPWTALTGGVVNKERSVKAFVLDPESSKSGRTLIVDIVTGGNDGEAEVAHIKASITGRNTTFGYPTTACDALPT